MVSSGHTHTLIIPEVFPEDEGEYVCEAYNDFGDTDTFCRLVVKGLQYNLYTTVRRVTGDDERIFFRQFSIKTYVVGKPGVVAWLPRKQQSRNLSSRLAHSFVENNFPLPLIQEEQFICY